MENVYGKVDRFYKDDLSSKGVVPQDVVEKYIRGLAWKGHTDAELTRSWDVIKSVLLFLDRLKIRRLDNLNVSDYQCIIYSEMDDSEGIEEFQNYVAVFISELERFYAAHPKLANDKANRALKETADSFTNGEKFSLPYVESKAEFQLSLGDLGQMDEDFFCDDIEEILAALFSDVADYYRGPEYKTDVSRALTLFTNPGDIKDQHKERAAGFWTDFWNYFFLDYHLIENDRLPLQQYLLDNEDDLSELERSLIKWYLRTSFNVYTINYVDGEYIEAQELLTGTKVGFSCNDGWTLWDSENTLICGHRFMGYPMELDFMSFMEATPNQQKRIKDELLHQFEAFKLQEPEATIQDFMSRHAGAVLHNIQLISSGRLLRAAIYNSGAQAMCVNEERTVPSKLTSYFNLMAKKLGVSAYGCTRAVRLYKAAYGYIMENGIDEYDDNEVMAASLLMFKMINGMYDDTLQVFREFDVDENRVCNLMDILKEGIKCCFYDTRYLAEEGFVNSLYKLYY